MCVAYAAARQLQVHRREAASTSMCAGKKFAGGFDQVKTHHQKIMARIRRAISAGSVRAEPARREK